MSLLERDRELTAIQALVEEGGLLLIEGGAGIGKSSLLAAACERATNTGHEVLRARGSELEAGFAFGVVRQLFERRVAGASSVEREALFAGPAGAARQLLSGEPGDISARDRAFAVVHGLYWLAANLAATRPLVIAVDDIQWVDGASLRWLAYLTPRTEGLPLSILATLRPVAEVSEEAALTALRGAATILRPPLLSQIAVADIVRRSTGAEATDELCVSMWRESGGNPFYLHELLRASADGVPMRRGVGLTHQVAARVRGLDRRALRFAQALSVLGDGCELRHAAAVASVDIPTAVRFAAGLVQVEVLASDDPPRFLHPVVREAVEASMASDELDAAHRGAARLLHAEGASPGRVGAHLLRVRPAGDAWVFERLREAALTAVVSGAPQAGADILRRALAEPPPRVERVAVLREAAGAEVLAGHESACALLEEASAQVSGPLQRGQIKLELAEAHANLYQWTEAFDVCEAALRELGESDSVLASRLEAELVICGLREAHRAPRALTFIERLGARRLERGPAETLAVARGLVALQFSGRPADEVAHELQPAFERGGQPPAGNWDVALPALVALIGAERFSEAEAALTAMMAEADRSGSARGLVVTHASLAMLKLRLGSLSEADAAARVALRLVQSTDLLGLPFVVWSLGEAGIEAGELGEAERCLALLPAAGLKATLPTMQIPVARGHLRLAQGRPADALTEFETCRRLASSEVWGMEMRDGAFTKWRSGAALALMGLGDRDRARELAESELADARHFGAPRSLGIALRAAGLASGGERGVALLHESVAVLRTSTALLERAHSLAELGAALRRTGKRGAARDPLTEALDLAARCGARPLAARAREELKAIGVRPRREWRTGVEALTPGETRVARLAADGKTNREIALTLYVTLKTVEGHLARAYGKLGIGRREELRQVLEGEKTRVTTR